MLIALLYRREFTIPLPIRIVMVVGALIAAWLSTPYFVSYRLLGWGVPAALIAAAALLGDRRAKPGPIMSPVVTLGDASYSIYLFQAMVIGLVGKVWGPALYDFPVVPILAVCFVAMIALSITVFQFFERPVTRILRRLFGEQLSDPHARPMPSRAIDDSTLSIPFEVVGAFGVTKTASASKHHEMGLGLRRTRASQEL
jgi:peptidoglycan/LPS O-acetylase OafA/YrhL